MLQRVKEVQESDLRMVGALARNIQRVIAVTQADIDAAAVQGKAWVVKPVVKVSDPLDNLRGGTQLVIKQNSILPGQNVMRVMYIGGQAVVVGPGTSPLPLPDATDNDILSLIAFGGTEQRNLPDSYIQRQFIYMMDGSYLAITNQSITSDYKIEFDFATTNLSSSLANYFGARASGVAAGGGFRVTKLSNQGVAMYGFDTTDAYESGANILTANTRYKYVYENGTCKLSSGGTDVLTHTYTVNDTSTITAFGINAYTSNGTSFTASGLGIYCYGLKMWNAQGELVANYVPAVQKGTVPVVGFYDTVSKTFKTATAGTFAAGGEAVPTPDAPMDIVSNNGVLKARHQSGLPLGYTAVEYIQSSGSQYIDTGRVPNNNDIIEQKFQKNGTNTATCSWYGSMPSSQTITPRIGIGSYLSQGSGTSMFAGSNYTGNIGVADTNVHTLRFQATGRQELTYTLDGVTDVIDASTSPTPPDMYEPAVELTSYLFARHGTNGVQAYDNEGTKIYYHREYLADGTLVLNMVPVKRNSDNVLGMYDLVSGQFFTNQGTGDFVAGSAVSDPVEIYTDGTVETIGMIAGNIISDDIAGANINSAGKVVSSGKVIHIAPVVPGEIYTCDSVGVIAYFTDIPVMGSVSYDGSRVTTTNPTFTVPNDSTIKYVAFSNDIATSYCVQGSVLYNGGTATAEMLLKVGDYQDVQSIIDGVVTRNVGVKVLDGTEGWVQSAATNNLFYATISNSNTDNTYIPISSHFQGVVASTGYATMANGQFKHGSNTNSWYFKNTDCASAAEFSQFLANQYNAGTPVIVLYPLATPTTESVTAQPMQTVEGDNTAEITQASLDNLELQVEYIEA